MKIKNYLRVVLFVMVIVFLPKQVFAEDCDLAAMANNGEYNIPAGSTCTVSEDITITEPFIISEGTVTIELDHDIIYSNPSLQGGRTAISVSNDANLIITGLGTIRIAHPNPFISSLYFASSGNLTINSGTYAEGISVIEANHVTINGGSFITISHENQLVYIEKLTINGGYFEGGLFGILISNPGNSFFDEPFIYGGTFVSTNDDSHAIEIGTAEKQDNNLFNLIIGDNYHYSNTFNTIFIDYDEYIPEPGDYFADPGYRYLYATDIHNLSIVEGAPTEEQKNPPYGQENNKEKVQNPKTGSMLYIYILLFLFINAIVVVGTYKYHKKIQK